MERGKGKGKEKGFNHRDTEEHREGREGIWEPHPRPLSMLERGDWWRGLALTSLGFLFGALNSYSLVSDYFKVTRWRKFLLLREGR